MSPSAESKGYLSPAEVDALIRRVRWTVIAFMVPFVFISAFIAVTIHDLHVHGGHIAPIEQRLTRLECVSRLDPGEQTSDDLPFIEGTEKNECGER